MIDDPISTSGLMTILSDDLPAVRPNDVPQLLSPLDSWSGARFLRWSSDSGPMVLKIWPWDSPTRERHEWRHHKILGLSDFQPTLALPVADRKGRTLRALPDERMAELFRWLDGEPVSLKPSGELAGRVAAALAHLHLALIRAEPVRTGVSAAIARRLAGLKDPDFGGSLQLLNQEIVANKIRTEIQDQIAARLRAIVTMAQRLRPFAVRALEPIAATEFPLQTVLRDVRPNHFLTTGGEITGIIDFGAIGVDTVALDISRLLGEWHSAEPTIRTDFFRTYDMIRRLSTAEIAAMEALIPASAILGGLAWLDIHLRRRLTAGREAAFLQALRHAEDRLRGQCNRFAGRI